MSVPQVLTREQWARCRACNQWYPNGYMHLPYCLGCGDGLLTVSYLIATLDDRERRIGELDEEIERLRGVVRQLLSAADGVYDECGPAGYDRWEEAREAAKAALKKAEGA